MVLGYEALEDLGLVPGRRPRLADIPQVPYAVIGTLESVIFDLLRLVADRGEQMGRPGGECNVDQGRRGEAQTESLVVCGEERIDARGRSIAALRELDTIFVLTLTARLKKFSPFSDRDELMGR